MNTNSIEIQLQKALEMKATVQEFAKILMQRMDDLEGQLSYYVRVGFPEDTAANYHQRYYRPDREIIDNLSNSMLKTHVEFLDKVIGDLTSAKNINIM